MKDIFKESIQLETTHFSLVPFDEQSSEGLDRIAFDAETWEFMETRVTDGNSLADYRATAIREREQAQSYPFIVYDKKTNQVAGSTRFGLIDPVCKALEIGWTWYGKAYRGSGINKACKYLLLSYAFESLGANRVSFAAATENRRSRRAIEKIGGVFEGVLREVFPDPEGHFRDLAVFSILKSEWETLKSTTFAEFL
jgi:RimJ/RimL family protein N-acetyltransferase